MAQIHGNVANYPARKRRELLLRMFVIVLLLEAAAGFLVGLSVSSYLPAFGSAARGGLLLLGAAGLVVVFLWGMGWIKRNEADFFRHVDGAHGEDVVAAELRKLRDDFHVIHGIETPSGDIDALVIGPTGVFALDAKKWSRWSIRHRSQGHARKLQCRVMELRKLLIKPGGPDPYLQGALVFVAAEVGIPRGGLGHIDALEPDELVGYITRTQGRRGLSAAEVELLASRAMAHVK